MKRMRKELGYQLSTSTLNYQLSVIAFAPLEAGMSVGPRREKDTSPIGASCTSRSYGDETKKNQTGRSY